MTIYLLLGIILLLLIVVVAAAVKTSKEGFQPWSTDLLRRFNIYQTTANLNVTQFNLDQLQKQASPEEVEEFLRRGKWSWPEDLKALYLQKVAESPIIKIDPQYALNYAMKIYNPNAATQLLSWNTKEGQFLLYGGLNKDQKATIQCSNTGKMQKTTSTGDNLWNGYKNIVKTEVQPADIPSEMPGFQFVHPENPCNPCVALDNDNSCPFLLNVEGDSEMSAPWKKRWQLS